MKTVDEILRELDFGEVSYAHTKSELRQIILEELSKLKRELKRESIYLQYDRGYNSCLDDCQFEINELFEEKK